MRALSGLFAINLMVCDPVLAAECDFSQPPERQLLSDALNSRDQAEIDRVVLLLNPTQSAPDIPKLRQRGYQDISGVPVLSPTQREELVNLHLRAAQRIVEGIADQRGTPQDLPFALRHLAGIVRGSVALAKAYPDTQDTALGMAEIAADYLVQASQDAGVPFAPFPYWRGRSGRLGELSEEMARGLEACDGLETRVRNGWFVVPEVPEQYYFDTGRVGTVLAELMAVRPKHTYRDWLDRAAAWLDGENLSSNFNYNAFPAEMFAARHRHLGDPQDLERALDWLQFGVLPGMISEGPDAGQWIDPHNNLLPYRVIMLHAMLSARREVNRARLEPDPKLDQAIALALGAVEDDVRDDRVVESAERMIEIYIGLDTLAAQGVSVDFDQQLREDIEKTATRWLAENTPRGDLATALFLANLKDVKTR